MLLCIAQSLFGVGVYLYEKAVGFHVQCHLGQMRHKVGASCHVAGITDYGQPGYAAAQFNGYLPLRRVTVNPLVV